MLLLSHTEALAFLKKERVNERNLNYREAIFSLDSTKLTKEELLTLENIYFKLKDVELRYKLLSTLSKAKNVDTKEFFQQSYKKERSLDMKLLAIRGLVNFLSEKEINKKVEHFCSILAKRPDHTPYNYLEYEYLKSPSGLPYLIKGYNYASFSKALKQVEK